jgi:hypothetical protein
VASLWLRKTQPLLSKYKSCQEIPNYNRWMEVGGREFDFRNRVLWWGVVAGVGLERKNLRREPANPAAIQRDKEIPYRTDVVRELGAAMRVRDAKEDHRHKHGA